MKTNNTRRGEEKTNKRRRLRCRTNIKHGRSMARDRLLKELTVHHVGLMESEPWKYIDMAVKNYETIATGSGPRSVPDQIDVVFLGNVF